MKAGFFVQLAMAIMFGLVAGLPYHTRMALEARVLVTTTEVITVTVPAVIIHVQGTKTWTETNVPTKPNLTATISVMSESSIVTSKPKPSTILPTPPVETNSEAATIPPIQVTESSYHTYPIMVTEPSIIPPGTTAVSEPEPVYSDWPTEMTQTLTPIPSHVAGGGHGNGYGISYNPYNADGSCKDSSAIASDIDKVSDYGMVRLYGIDCHQLDSVMPVVKKYPGMKLFLGIWNAEAPETALDHARTIVAAVNDHFDGDWSLIHTVSVGNEVVTRHAGSVDAVRQSLIGVKDLLRHYNVPVVTVEQPDVFQQGDGVVICQESDYTAINAHPFFDMSGDWKRPERAGEFTKLMASLLSSCGHQRTVITESGWPHGSDLGESYFTDNGLPVPNLENHNAAIQALKDTYVGAEEDLIVFSAFDDLWKQDTATTNGVEHYWGIY